MFKSKVLFLSEKRSICQNQMVFDKVMTRILTQKIAAYIQKTKVLDITPNVWKSKKGASQWKLIFCVVGFLSELRKKLKIATFTEAPFMVKSDF